MAKKRRKSVGVRHPFLYKVTSVGGQVSVYKAMATVKPATQPVSLELTAAHVRESIKINGVGNTARCAVAVCARRHAEAFPHEVEGHIDFTYTRCFVVSKLDRETGLPRKCVVYEHDGGDVAKLNDVRGGQRKLLRMIEKDGPITIELKPHRPRSAKGRPGKGRGTTGKRAVAGKGANLRYAVMQLGAYPTEKE